MESNNVQRVRSALEECLQELTTGSLDVASRDGTLASDLHLYYNQVGLKEGWLKPEYATPLSKQDATNKRKNVDAAADVVRYWIGRFDRREYSLVNAVDEMILSCDYEKNRGYVRLEEAADSQHEQWKRFVEAHQKERVTPGHAKFREANYKQFLAPYKDLSEKEKDQDRLIVSVVTDAVLARAGFERTIKL